MTTEEKELRRMLCAARSPRAYREFESLYAPDSENHLSTEKGNT